MRLSFLVRVLAAAAFAFAGLGASFVAPAGVAAQGPTFGDPVGSAPLGEPLTVTSRIDDVGDGTVELLVRLQGAEPQVVFGATPGSGAGEYQATAAVDVAVSSACACHLDGTSSPNTKIEFQFRVRGADGTVS